MAAIDTVRLNALTIKYILKTLTVAEQQELDDLLDRQTAIDPTFRDRFDQRVDATRLKDSLEAYLRAQEGLSVPISEAGHSRLPVRKIRRYWSYMAAAAVGIGVIALLWLTARQPRESKPQHDPIIAMEHDFKPGGNRATLTLGNGEIIDLDSARNGVVSRQGSSAIVKTTDGKLNYQPGEASATSLVYNVVSTPKGGTYQVVLPDGSHAWLNAASTIRFPVSFPKDRREMTITGEVYFDVVHDAAKPFVVHTDTRTVQVLGTEFDMQNYPNEPASLVTLLRGSVRVETGGQSRILEPGQQLRLTPEGTLAFVEHPDPDQATAWRSGFFKFKNADIHSIMREIERWYDVTVSYQLSDSSMTYGGRISRDLPLSQLLRLLQGNNIHHYKMEGRHLIVLP